MNANSVTGLDISGNLIEIAKKENPKIKFYVGNAAKSPFKNSQFNLVSSSLMVHYFKNLKPLFKEVSRILKKKGFFVFSMHHPIMEISGKLNVKGIKGSLLKPYFHNNKYLWTLHKKINLVSYHHTLENIINSLNDSGFVIERILEPKASEKTKKINKKMYYRTNLRPSFLIIKARKEK